MDKCDEEKDYLVIEDLKEQIGDLEKQLELVKKCQFAVEMALSGEHDLEDIVYMLNNP